MDADSHAHGVKIARRNTVLAHLRNKLRSGDVYVERSASYRRFDTYLAPSAEATSIAGDLGLPGTPERWLAERGQELDDRLRRFARRLARGQLEGVGLIDGRLSISPRWGSIFHADSHWKHSQVI